MEDVEERHFMEVCDSALNCIKGKLRSDAVRQGVSCDIFSHMLKILLGLEMLVKKQDHFRNSFMDFATVAIFFSSITATTLQFSFTAANTSFSWTIVNLCWFGSLVLSIASATNSFLGAVVHQSPEFLRPSQRVDHQILQKWFKIIPPILLTISGALFLIGICSFTFSSTSSIPSQGRATQVFTTTLTSPNFLALITMFLLAFTRVFYRTVHLGIAFIHFATPPVLMFINFTTPGVMALVRFSTPPAHFATHLTIVLVTFSAMLVSYFWFSSCFRS